MGGSRFRPTFETVKKQNMSPPQIRIVQSPFWFYEQPDDGPFTRPKHVVYILQSVAYYIVTPSDKLLCS